MAKMQKLPKSSVTTSGSSYGSCKPEVASDQFPAGLRVLVVDDDAAWLKIVEKMLRRCMYKVTPCSQAAVALTLLREKKGCFDVVLSDVHMPDMDGFKLLEHVGLEMDLPVIMMSADGTTSAVMKGVRHGACDYLIKPIREEELKNIWQHVVRKKWNENREVEPSGSLEDDDPQKRGIEDVEFASSVNEATEGIIKTQKKRRDGKEEDDGELENDDPSTSKKPRVVWSVELHQQFVSAVNQLGIDKAVPKRILELMNVPGLTRENVASHLQKFRLYLKRLSGVAQQGGVPNSFCGPLETNAKLGTLGRFDIQALAASSQIPPQTLAALHAELLGRPTSTIMLPSMDQPSLLQSFGQQPLIKCQSNIPKHFQQSIVSVEDVPSGFGSWPSNSLNMVRPNREFNSQNNNTLMDMLQQQQKLPEPSRSINVQPSCLVVPTQSSSTFQARNSPAALSQNCNFNKNGVIDYSLVSPPLINNSPLGIGEVTDGGDFKTTCVISGYSGPSSITSSLPSVLINSDGSTSQKIQNSTINFGAGRLLPYGSVKLGEVTDCEVVRNHGFVGKGTCIPSRFAVDELESPVTILNDISRVKQEPNLDFVENSKLGVPMLQHLSPNDLMSVLSE